MRYRTPLLSSIRLPFLRNRKPNLARSQRVRFRVFEKSNRCRIFQRFNRVVASDGLVQAPAVRRPSQDLAVTLHSPSRQTPNTLASGGPKNLSPRGKKHRLKNAGCRWVAQGIFSPARSLRRSLTTGIAGRFRTRASRGPRKTHAYLDTAPTNPEQLAL